MIRYLLFIFSFLSCVCVFAKNHQPTDFLKSIAGSPAEGDQIVAHFCSVCHAEHPDISVGAPRAHRSEDWKPRLKQGLSVLFEHTNEGLGAMPPRGGCFECTDEQLMLAIRSLIEEKNQITPKKIIKNH